MAGVSMGVGFTIMMAGLMQGSQLDFLRQLVDTMPHITVEDERRSVPTQPPSRNMRRSRCPDIANVGKRPGIKYPESVMSSLRSWIPGDVAPSAKTTAIINHGGARIGITLTGIDPRREVKVSKLAAQMREGKLDDLARAPNGILRRGTGRKTRRENRQHRPPDRRPGHPAEFDGGPGCFAPA
jgi:lipoprotein-releasing system permease protein